LSVHAFYRAFISLILLLAFFHGHSQEIEAHVVGISEGDTVTLLISGNRQLKVRLDGIDAPEDGQEFSAVSKRILSSWIAGKTVTLTFEGTGYLFGSECSNFQIFRVFGINPEIQNRIINPSLQNYSFKIT